MNYSPPPILSPPWSPRTKYTAALLILIAISIFLFLMRDILFIVIAAVVIAYLLNPLVTFWSERVFAYVITSRRWRRVLAVLMTFVLVFLLFTIVALVVVPILVNQFQEFGRQFPELLRAVINDIEQILSEPLMFNNEPILIGGEPFIPLGLITSATGSEIDELIHIGNFDLVGAIQSFIGSVGGLTGPAFNVVGSAVNVLVTGSLLLIMIFYLLRDGNHFVNVIIESTPKTYRSDVRRLLVELMYVWNAYLRGQILLGLIMGIIVYIVALLLGVPNAPILGLLAGLLEFIPNLGPLLALVPAAFLALLSQSLTLPFLEGVSFMFVVIITWTGLQMLESIFLVPRIMGTSLDLHPFVVIVAVIAGAAIAGPLGVILAAPIVASIRVLWLYFYGKLTDQNLLPVHRASAQKSTYRHFAVPVMLHIIERTWDWVEPRVPGRAGQSPIEKSS